MTSREKLAAMVPSDTLLRFAEALILACVIADDQLLYFFEKPWKWADEFEAWQGAGEPLADDVGWAQFETALGTIA